MSKPYFILKKNLPIKHLVPTDIAPFFGSSGIKLNEVCSVYNKYLSDYPIQYPEYIFYLRVKLIVYNNKSFKLLIQYPSITSLIQQLTIKFNTDKYISQKMLDIIIELKLSEQNTKNKNLIYKTILGTIRSMKFNVLNNL